MLKTASAIFFVSSTLAYGETVEIYALDLLDNTQNGYCVDISGGQAAQADPADGLQGHTCYSPSGEIFVDQGFDESRFSEGVLYMPAFDVCAEVAGLNAGAALGLVACEDRPEQRFIFSGHGTITPASDAELCVTLGDETRFGRSPTNQIKNLTLEVCREDMAAFQMWGNRTADE